MEIKLDYVFDKDSDFYKIVRVHHDDRKWWGLDSDGKGMQWMASERLSPEACIEGDKMDIDDLIEGIQQKKEVRRKRCAVSPAEDGTGFLFWSPKNSEHKVYITNDEAYNFVEKAFILLGDKGE